MRYGQRERWYVVATVRNSVREITIHNREDTTYGGQTVDTRATEIIRGPRGLIGATGTTGAQGPPGEGEDIIDLTVVLENSLL